MLLSCIANQGRKNEIKLVKKHLNWIRNRSTASELPLGVKTEMEAINFVLRQFDTDIQLAEITLEDAGTFNFEEI